MKRIIFILLALSFSMGVFAKQPQRGYRGFIEWSNGIRSYETWIGSSTDYFTGISTSHGYQIIPWVYAGVGVDFEVNKEENWTCYILAPFFDVRSDMKFGKFTPFVDARIGYNFSNDGGGVTITSKEGGVYFSPHIGYRFNWGRKIGVNIGLGLTLIGYDGRYQHIITPSGPAIGGKGGCDKYFSFRLGIDF